MTAAEYTAVEKMIPNAMKPLIMQGRAC